MGIAERNRRETLISGIRELANFLENHPDIPAPYSLDAIAFPGPNRRYTKQCAEIDRVADATNANVQDRAGHYTAQIEFGHVRYRLVAISDQARAEYDALMSYNGSVTPDHADADAPTADIYGGKCSCGALTAKGARRCRKCANRGRWNRRKAPFGTEEGQQ
ncbi:hypothetical protein ACWENQ_39800 [Nonomuraea sp. NPDC004354]